MRQRPIPRARPSGRSLAAMGVLLLSVVSSHAAERWASCPDGSPVDTGTAFGAPHIATYGGSLSPELLQAAGFVALTQPQQRAGVFDIVTRRLHANGVRFDPDEWAALATFAAHGVDDNAGMRGLLYGLASGYSRTPVPGIYRLNEGGAFFARDAVDLDARECVLWQIIDKLIQSPCAQTAGGALYLAARANGAAQRACVPPPKTQSSRLLLTDLRTAPGGGLKVWIDKASAKPGSKVRFRVSRVAGGASTDPAQQIWSGEATIASDPSGALYAIVARGIKLAADASRPFFQVDVDPPSGSQGPVSCEPPSGWHTRHLDPELNGLHGPYQVPTVEDAVANDAAVCIAFQQSKALQRWEGTEFGYTVLRNKSTGAYFTTPPERSDTDLKVFTRDYAHSIDKAFERSCENKDDYAYVAEVHTHPAVLPFPAAGDYYSLRDFNRAIQLVQIPAQLRDESGQRLMTDALGVGIEFDKSVLIDTRNRHVYWFKPKPADLLFGDVDAFDHGIPSLSSERSLWQSYIDSSRAIAVPCVK
jgi:hypothetical protein